MARVHVFAGGGVWGVPSLPTECPACCCTTPQLSALHLCLTGMHLDPSCLAVLPVHASPCCPACVFMHQPACTPRSAATSAVPRQLCHVSCATHVRLELLLKDAQVGVQ